MTSVAAAVAVFVVVAVFVAAVAAAAFALSALISTAAKKSEIHQRPSLRDSLPQLL